MTTHTEPDRAARTLRLVLVILGMALAVAGWLRWAGLAS
jgi:uncharacterized membrane protein YidH (DUF202 family)